MTEDNIDQSKLDELATAVARLPRSIEPPEDFWPAIRAGITTIPVRVVAWWQRPAILAAAAMLLIAGSSLATLAVVRNGGSRDATQSTAAPAPVAGGDATLAQFTRIETDYIRTVNELSAVLEAQQSELAPGTIAKLHKSLRVIDAAIVEARAALAADPSNKHLTEILSATYEQKVDLIRRTTEMAVGS
ncbi:MAG TPA: hypothetical protein VIF83_09830 [Gemmatimonadaceae bacterium]